ncbi:amino acid--tRNA ligase-related protein [Marispirochaeta aestuarii]|uniref:amino acid--tRNA ligase-related protein n=1 Tax=Marispirochaeta aestuarii TaxID=1963862 RepID=UPI0029C8C762|nr:amino acid--tRNA ligase-related protein [Marispirochaeta aestuarii]
MIDLSTAGLRTDILHETRNFFRGRGFLEADTPLLAEKVIPEPTIELFPVSFSNPYGRDRELYLLPSPEYWLKKLLKMFPETPVFQLARAFRNREQSGRLHNIEFTMLEWYRPGSDYRDIEAETREYITAMADFAGVTIPGFRSITVEEAFTRYTGLELAPLCDDGEALRRVLAERDIFFSPSDDWNDLFQRLFITLIEPALPSEMPLFLYDYPAGITCLAREKEDGPYRERWELYWKGIELANCYTEMTDPETVKSFLAEEAAEKERSAVVRVNPDTEYWRTFQVPYPASSGVALGFDRLLMLLAGKENLEDVIYFPFTP